MLPTSHAEPTVRAAVAADAAAVARIYNHYVEGTIVTFEEEAVSPDEIARRMADVQGGGLPWLIAETAGEVLGYAYAGKWRPRRAYRYAVESTVYLAPTACGRGVGRLLYTRLLELLRGAGIHTVIGVIALPNPASVGLHEKLGFKPVGQLEQVGWKLGRWIDVGHWQRSL